VSVQAVMPFETFFFPFSVCKITALSGARTRTLLRFANFALPLNYFAIVLQVKKLSHSDFHLTLAKFAFVVIKKSQVFK
jgi:hypothetical protein